MTSARANEENVSGHGNQHDGASQALETHGSQASGTGSAGPQLARRKGRSFGASIIAHLRPTDDCQTAPCPKFRAFGPHADSTNKVTTAQKAAGPLITVSTPEIPSNAFTHKNEGNDSALTLQQSTPPMKTRKSHGAAMIASLAPSAVTPNSGPPGRTKPPGNEVPSVQCMEACPNTHVPATIPETAVREPVLALHTSAHQAPLPQAAPPDTLIKSSEGYEVHTKGLTESQLGRISNEYGRELVVRAPPAAVAPLSPEPPPVQAQEAGESQAAPEPPADLIESEGVTQKSGIPRFFVPIRLHFCPRTASHSHRAYMCIRRFSMPGCFIVSVWCPTLVQNSPSQQCRHAIIFMGAGSDDLCKVQPAPILASQKIPPPLHSPAIQDICRPNAAAGKPARGSHGAAMLMHLCSQLPAVSHTPPPPAEEVPATTRLSSPAYPRTQEPPQPVGGVTSNTEPAHAPNLCPQDVAERVTAPAPRHRSVGASMVACITGRCHAAISASKGKRISVDADAHAVAKTCPADEHHAQHHVATASSQKAAGTRSNC